MAVNNPGLPYSGGTLMGPLVLSGDPPNASVGNPFLAVTKEYVDAGPLGTKTLTYTSGLLTGISYPDGSSKALTYTSGVLTQTVLTRSGYNTVTKNFNYTSGVLSSIVVSSP
jgi:hypothetical protein